ncbi:hypothetical protein KCU78_g11472, partial [Aureobasidium melanogenum]
MDDTRAKATQPSSKEVEIIEIAPSPILYTQSTPTFMLNRGLDASHYVPVDYHVPPRFVEVAPQARDASLVQPIIQGTQTNHPAVPPAGPPPPTSLATRVPQSDVVFQRPSPAFMHAPSPPLPLLDPRLMGPPMPPTMHNPSWTWEKNQQTSPSIIGDFMSHHSTKERTQKRKAHDMSPRNEIPGQAILQFEPLQAPPDDVSRLDCGPYTEEVTNKRFLGPKHFQLPGIDVLRLYDQTIPESTSLQLPAIDFSRLDHQEKSHLANAIAPLRGKDVRYGFFWSQNIIMFEDGIINDEAIWALKAAMITKQHEKDRSVQRRRENIQHGRFPYHPGSGE